jgi:hypothetical protein
MPLGRVVCSAALLTAALLAPAPAAWAVEAYNVADHGSPQAAIDAAEAAGGGLVRFPCGTVVLSAPLSIEAPGVTLEGCGPGGTKLVASFAIANIISFGANPPFSPCGGVRNLSITSSVQRVAGHAIVVNGCEQGVLENLRIDTNGGHGIRFSDGANSLASIFFVRSVDIEIHGAFTAIDINGANDRYFDHVWLRGDRAPGSRGIRITQSGGDWWNDIESVLFEIGVDVVPPSGKEASWINFNNVLADTNRLHGFRFTGQSRGISCVRCWASTNGSQTLFARGILVEAGTGITFTDPRVLNNGGHGIELRQSASDIAISGGIITGNCISPDCPAGLGNGIMVDGANGFRIQHVRSGSTVGQGNKQGYGIFVNRGSDNFIVTGNDTRANVFGGILNVPGTAPNRLMNTNF